MSALEINTYQQLAARSSKGETDVEKRKIIAALGLAGEAGEFANIIKKQAAHGHTIPNQEFADELGDVLWYLSEAATACGLSLGDIANQNIEKLKKRYPEGFSEERSINRPE
jgi:NTP pyrophosphatase (non-canonical NTP hydrolase)